MRETSSSPDAPLLVPAGLQRLWGVQHSFLLDLCDLLVSREMPGMTKLMLGPRHEALQGKVEVWLMLNRVVVDSEGAQMLAGS